VTDNVIDWYRFELKPNASIELKDSTQVIVNVIPGDYNYDGKLDVLVMATSKDETKLDKTIEMKVYFGDGQESFTSEWRDCVCRLVELNMGLLENRFKGNKIAGGSRSSAYGL
jgi:hypothetical protein